MMKTGYLTWPWKAATAPADRPSVPRRQRHGVEYCLVLAIVCFAALSTFNAIAAKHSPASTDQVALRQY
jgi:hypothetical protein